MQPLQNLQTALIILAGIAAAHPVKSNDLVKPRYTPLKPLHGEQSQVNNRELHLLDGEDGDVHLLGVEERQVTEGNPKLLDGENGDVHLLGVEERQVMEGNPKLLDGEDGDVHLLGVEERQVTEGNPKLLNDNGHLGVLVTEDKA